VARASVSLREKEIARLKREIARLDGRLTSANTTFYFQKIAEALPLGLRVTRLSIDRNAADGAIVIAGEIRSDVDLVRFIDALDRTHLWSEVRLMRASQAGFGSGGAKSFEIRGKW
jgi:Tfp pilus assembly protein PilN